MKQELEKGSGWDWERLRSLLASSEQLAGEGTMGNGVGGMRLDVSWVAVLVLPSSPATCDFCTVTLVSLLYPSDGG